LPFWKAITFSKNQANCFDSTTPNFAGGIMRKILSTYVGRVGAFLSVCSLALFLSASALAQSGFSGVRGTVKDPQGNSVKGATITLTDVDRNSSRTQTSNSEGSYLFTSLLPGLYKVTVEAAGFKKAVIENVRAVVDVTADVSPSLEVGAVSEIITVTSSSLESVVNTQDASLGNNFVSQQINTLPLNARNVADLLSLQPGVVFISTAPNVDDTRSGAVGGGRSDQANITLDGVDVNDQVNGFAFTSVLRVTPDSISEFRVTTSNPNASQGRSSGAQVSLLTKSGTNEVHGTLFWFHRNEKTAANDFFNNRVGKERPALKRNQYGGAVSGPVVKDRLFFFFTYEGQRIAQGIGETRLVPRASLGAGNLSYRNTAGGVTTLNATQIGNLFPSVGVNQTALRFLADAARRYPVNDSTIGDNLNTGGFRFNAPLPIRENTSIAKFDWNIDSQSKHVLSARFNYQNDNSALNTQWLPDTPTPTRWRHPIGTAISHTWMVSNNKVNTARFGLTRDAFTNIGDSSANSVSFRDVFTPFRFQRNSSRVSPVYNYADDFTWTKRSHTLQFGGNVRVIRNRSVNFAQAYDAFNINFSFYAGAGAVLLTPFTDVSGGFSSSMQAAVSALIGRAPDYTARFNFNKDGSLLGAGVPNSRNIATEEYESYAQDSWKFRNTLTINYGLRYSLSRPVYEKNGFQARTTTPLGEIFDKRVAGSNQGRAFNDLISIDLAGPANNKPGNYEMDKNNFQPRVSFAWSPNFKSGVLGKVIGSNGDFVMRGGYALTNDVYGTQIALQFDANNTLGFASAQQVAANTYNVTTRPGVPFSAVGQTVRGLPGITVPTSVTFPRQQAPNNARRIESSLDATVRAPYSHSWNFTLGRKLPASIYVEAAYVGRLGRNLLATRDVMALNNLKDPQSGVDWYTAAGQLADLRARNVAISSVTPIPYFENLFRNANVAAGLADYWGDTLPAGLSRTQAIYAFIARASGGFNAISGSDWTTLQDALDYALTDFQLNGQTGSPVFFHPQYATLGAWGSFAESNYNAFNVSLRQRFKNQLTWDLNYSLSKSFDTASGVQRAGSFGTAFILNPLRPRDNRSVSNFDVRHIINFNSLWQIPVGKKRSFLSNAPGVVNQIIGGWDLNTIVRGNSGLPVDAPFDGRRWATNWNVQSNGVLISPLKSSPTRGPGIPNLFSNPNAASRSFRNPLAGETGTRNPLRDPGYFALDFGLIKSFPLPWYEGHSLEFRWEVFNATNTQRFTGAETANFLIPADSVGRDAGPNFGNFTSIQGQPRQMQFSLRYRF
jgi:Carboxypeptidase regulatory-like domain